MVALNTILNNGWDAEICTKPSFIYLKRSNYRFYTRVITTQLINIKDEAIGIPNREYFDVNSYDAYRCIAVTETSEADLRNMLKAIEKVCATYTPTSTENIIQWSEAGIREFNNIRWQLEFIVYVRKAGIAAY